MTMTDAALNDPSHGVSCPVRQILSSAPPRASSFIVTIYGDVVEPRGGVLWMGTLIDCCARHGISESLVRTAVSRLVAAGRLEGQRIGRKSFYRLSDAGRREFRAAARIVFAPPPLPTGWLVALGEEEAALPPGWIRLAPGTAIAPEHEGMALPDRTVMSASSIAGDAYLPDFAARHWPLTEVADTYRDFMARFAYLPEDEVLARLEPGEALALRLRLVDEYRRAALTDPRLPAAALPADWPASQARGAFRRIYLALTPASERFIGQSFADSEGLLPEATVETQQRTADLGTS